MSYFEVQKKSQLNTNNIRKLTTMKKLLLQSVFILFVFILSAPNLAAQYNPSSSKSERKAQKQRAKAQKKQAEADRRLRVIRERQRIEAEQEATRQQQERKVQDDRNAVYEERRTIEDERKQIERERARLQEEDRQRNGRTINSVFNRKKRKERATREKREKERATREKRERERAKEYTRKNTAKKKEKLSKRKTTPKADIPDYSPSYNKKTKNSVIREAQKHLGTPYIYGGEQPGKGFDCSGFTQYVYGKSGIRLPRTAREQARYGKKVKLRKAKTGDLVFFSEGKVISHVGIISDVRGNEITMIHASSSEGITFSNIQQSAYWRKRMRHIQRVGK